MGKFLNTDKKNTIDSLVTGLQNRLNNPYYQHNDKKATIVEYFNVNTQMSTLDEALKTYQELIGSKSPIMFNAIDDFYLYGLERIQISMESGDFGVEASSIEGEAYILPNTIIPIPGDFFKIKYLEKYYMFKVTESSIDTLESSANFYKINYKYDAKDDTEINLQVAERYTLVSNNIGNTVFSPIIRNNDYELIKIFDDISVSLKNYYKALFYNGRVESFIFKEFNANFYDPYLTEFIIRNRLIEGSGDFLLIKQQMYLPASFVIDYDASFFKSLELRDKDNLSIKTKSTGKYISDPVSLLSMRSESYFSMIYENTDQPEHEGQLTPIPTELCNRIKSGVIYDPAIMDNIIIDFFNKKNLNKELVSILEKIDYSNNITLFYYIPMLIFIIEHNIKELMGQQFNYKSGKTFGNNSPIPPVII